MDETALFAAYLAGLTLFLALMAWLQQRQDHP